MIQLEKRCVWIGTYPIGKYSILNHHVKPNVVYFYIRILLDFDIIASFIVRMTKEMQLERV